MEAAKPYLALMTDSSNFSNDFRNCELDILIAKSTLEIQNLAEKYRIEMIVLDANGKSAEWIGHQLLTLRKTDGQCFICVFGEDVGRDAKMRLWVGEHGGSMTSWSVDSVMEAGRRVKLTLQDGSGESVYDCPFCQKAGLTEDTLWLHCPLYHSNEGKVLKQCPICLVMPSNYLQSHIRNCHGPAARGDVTPERQSLHGVHASAFCIVQRADKKILLVQEKRGRGYAFPGGRIDPGETLCEAAKRETLEEAGIDVEVYGILKIDFLPCDTVRGQYYRLRGFFMARPVDPEADIKSVPDYESVGAAWVGRDDLESGLLVRCPGRVLDFMKYLEEGKPIHPMSLLESTPLIC